MSDALIRREDRGPVRWLILNRENKLNALSMALLAELRAEVDAIAADPDVRAVVITGSGDKAFAAGADIAEFSSMGPAEARELALGGQAVFRAIETLDRPVIAAVNGYALGGGCELAMACHIRIASDNALFGQPEVKLGLIPGYGGTQRLPRLIGRGRAIEILITGRNVDAEEAGRIGLVNQVVAQDDLQATVEKMLKKILAQGPAAVGRCLEAVRGGMDLSLDDGCLLEATLFGVGAGSPEMIEGTTAFIEKRKADFSKKS